MNSAVLLQGYLIPKRTWRRRLVAAPWTNAHELAPIHVLLTLLCDADAHLSRALDGSIQVFIAIDLAEFEAVLACRPRIRSCGKVGRLTLLGACGSG